MTEQKKALTDEEKAAIQAEAQAKIEAARKRQAELLTFEESLRPMNARQLQRQLRRVGRNGGLDTAYATVLSLVLANTRVRKEQAFEVINGKKVFRPQWVNEEGRIGSYLR